ncbi:MAG: hypothetical protein MUE95_06455 [Cyclobacteriaceae bacterium]|nr:hypothetical protein [Cyclobacteriaceae bacterium]
MNTLKKFAPLFFALVVMGSHAQQVNVNKETSRIKNDQAEGFAVELEGNVDDVTNAFNKYIRSFARLKFGTNPMTTSEAVINGTSYKSPLYATVKEKGQGAQAWMGLKANEWTSEEDAQTVMKAIDKMMYDFGVKYYRDKIQVQIDETNRALQAVEKQQQRLSTENKNLTMKLENNQKEKLQLEKSLETNKLENQNLLLKMEQNKKSQDSVSVASEQIKKVLEMHQERQKKVN